MREEALLIFHFTENTCKNKMSEVRNIEKQRFCESSTPRSVVPHVHNKTKLAAYLVNISDSKIIKNFDF